MFKCLAPMLGLAEIFNAIALNKVSNECSVIF